MENEKHEQKPEKVSLIVPISIVIAGIIVAVAILFSGARSAANPKIPGSPESKLTKGTIAEEVGLDKTKFRECLASGSKADIVEADVQSGTKIGVQGTPYSVLVAKDGTHAAINGALPYSEIKKMIDKAIAGTLEHESGLNVDPVTEKDHIQGSADAPVVIIEYSDTECPFCQRYYETLKQVISSNKDKVAWVYRHFPLDMHPRARKEAEALECAAELGGNEKFWEYMDMIGKVSPLNNGLDPALL